MPWASGERSAFQNALGTIPLALGESGEAQGISLQTFTLGLERANWDAHPPLLWGGEQVKSLLFGGRFFYQFLLGHERVIAKEVRDEYVDTMSKIYLSYFKSYTNRLMKLQVSSLGRGPGLPSPPMQGPLPLHRSVVASSTPFSVSRTCSMRRWLRRTT